MEPKNTHAWIACFAASLTALDDPLTMSRKHDCSRIAELVVEYCRGEGLPEAEWGTATDAEGV